MFTCHEPRSRQMNGVIELFCSTSFLATCCKDAPVSLFRSSFTLMEAVELVRLPGPRLLLLLNTFSIRSVREHIDSKLNRVLVFCSNFAQEMFV